MDLVYRPRRLRRSASIRGLVRETELSPRQLIYPMFVTEGKAVREYIETMPGQFRLSIDELLRECEELYSLGVGAVNLFGFSAVKDAVATKSYDPKGLVQNAIRAIKGAVPDICVQTDVALDPYTTHGHDGLVIDGEIVNDESVEVLCKMALSHAEAGADWIAVSYVRTAEDIRPAKDAVKAAGLHTPIIAKIEHPSALKNLHSILEAADGVMVARGDLGVEIPLELVPIAQQNIIDAGLMRGMVVIVATQMLESMTLNPRPTRAEVSDVSTAIRQGGTAVMLSGETASGDHPIKAAETMVRIAKATEDGLTNSGGTPGALSKFRSTRAVAHAGVELAITSGARHILVATQHGNAPRLVSGYRPDMVVTAVTDRIRAARRMNLLPGVKSVMVDEYERGSQTMQEAIRILAAECSIKSGERIDAISGSPLAMRGATSSIRLYRLESDGTISGTE